MERESGIGDLGGFRLNVGLEFHKTIDYDRRAMRGALRGGAQQIAREAKRIVSRRAISQAGEFPGLQTGKLKRAIGIVSKGTKGGWTKVGVRSIDGSIFYPAFLFYGSPKTGLARRGNFMTAALATRRDSVRSEIQSALKNSLVPR